MVHTDNIAVIYFVRDKTTNCPHKSEGSLTLVKYLVTYFKFSFAVLQEDISITLNEAHFDDNLLKVTSSI